MKRGTHTRKKPMSQSSKGQWTFPASSTRCRSTHDVPYTLRCVLDQVHTLNLERHRDKEGNEW